MFNLEGEVVLRSLVRAVEEIVAKGLPAVLVYQRPSDTDDGGVEVRVAATDQKYLLYAAKLCINAAMDAQEDPGDDPRLDGDPRGH